MIIRRFFPGILSLLLSAGCESSIEVFPEKFQGYVIPDYFQEQILEKEEWINEFLSENINTSSFIFLTDVHWEINSRHSPEIIRHIQQKTGIQNVFFGGDAINGSTDKNDALLNASSFSDTFYGFENFYPVLGNHDSNVITANLQNPTLWFSDEEVYSFLHKQLSTKLNVKYGEYFYYYVDDPERTTRYLCLDTGKHSLYRKERQFAANALISTPNGWHIVIVTHIDYNANDLYDSNTLYIPDYLKPLIQMADLYNSCGVYIDDDQAVYDFSNIHNRVELIIGGHIHQDHIGYTEGGIPLVAIDSDCRHTYSPIGCRKGTINEHCITVVISNYNTNDIHLIRFGRGEDSTIHSY